MILTASLVKAGLFLIPSLTVEIPLGPFYVMQSSSAECIPNRINSLGPKTATWDVEAGVRAMGLSIFAGHRSKHDIGKADTQKSYDYFGASYQREFK
jgi:hypothetical protein